MTTRTPYHATEGNISPQTAKQQQIKKEQLAERLRENLRRRKAPAAVTGDEPV